jgi:hypothetical protein
VHASFTTCGNSVAGCCWNVSCSERTAPVIVLPAADKGIHTYLRLYPYAFATNAAPLLNPNASRCNHSTLISTEADRLCRVAVCLQGRHVDNELYTTRTLALRNSAGLILSHTPAEVPDRVGTTFPAGTPRARCRHPWRSNAPLKVSDRQNFSAPVTIHRFFQLESTRPEVAIHLTRL